MVYTFVKKLGLSNLAAFIDLRSTDAIISGRVGRI